MAEFTIKLHNCDIMTLKADACVSTIHRTKDMKKGPLASHILKQCGPTVQKELFKQKKELGIGEVITAPAGKKSDNFKIIQFVCLFRWREDNGEHLITGVTKCLEMASQKGFSSIAFPALGMGGLGYPPFEVAVAIMFALNYFFLNFPDTSLKTVHIALFDKDSNSVRTFLQTIMAFTAGADMIQNDGSPDVGLEGIENFNGLQITKPTLCGPGYKNAKDQGVVGSSPGRIQEAEKTPEQSKSSLIPNGSFNLSSPPINIGGGNDVLSYHIRPSFNLRNRTVGLNADLSFNLNQYLPGFLQKSS